MKPYPRYKPSGIEWIGDIPEHWEVKRLKHMAQINPSIDRQSIGDQQKLVPFLPMEKVSENGEIDPEVRRPVGELLTGFTYFEENDVILAKITPCFENGKGAIVNNLGGRFGFGSTEFHVLRPNRDIVVPKFLYYVTRTDVFRKSGEFSMFGAAGQKRVPKSFVENFYVCFPKRLDEQYVIIEYIDRSISSLSTLIEKKQKLIELLKEQRAAIINQAVTKGLNPNVKMKDSGVEWLGEIPEHWETKKLNHVINGGLRNGLFKRREEFGSGIKLVNVINLYKEDFCVNSDELERVEITDKELCDYKVNAGDIFFVRSSLKREGIGVSACIKDLEEPLVYECHLIKVIPDPNQVDFRYMINYLNSSIVRDRIISLSYTTTMTTISQPALSSLQVALPPVEEQAEIVEYIESETTRIHNIIYRINKEIELLQEYRTALISEIVTGKIDVRAEVAP